MDPNASGPLRIEPDETEGLPPEFADGVQPTTSPPIDPRVAARRADIDAKQALLLPVLEAVGCEAVLMLLPAHVAWFTAGMNVRGLIADSERPGVYTNGRQRWLLCSNVETYRLFDEELDQLGFQLKEWAWDAGRAELLWNVTSGRKVAGDRPFPNMPLVVDRLRPLLRVLSAFEQAAYLELGTVAVHAVEATARNITRGQSEEEIAGQIGHRLLRHGAEPVAVSVSADGRGERFRRIGFTSAPVQQTCTLQVTAVRDGLHVTASRTVGFGPPPGAFRTAFELALRLAAVYRSLSAAGMSFGDAKAATPVLLANTPHEYDGRLSQPGYGAGRFPAEELRRAGQDEPFAAGQPVVWQARVGPAAVVDTAIVNEDGPTAVTPPGEWPFKRVNVRGRPHDIPDILVRTP